MTTLTAIRHLTIVRTCAVCQQPSSETQGLIFEVGDYVHANCSTRNCQLVTAVSFPDEDLDPEPDPTTPAPAALVTGPELCEECRQFAPDYDDYCEACQTACNEWDSDRAPDYDVLSERDDWKRYYLIAA